MKLIEKILIGTDFGPSSEAVVQQAARVSKKFNSSVMVVHVIPDMSMSSLNQTMVHDAVDTELQIIAEQLTDQGISVETVIEKGIPFIQLMKTAELNDVNVIMVGSGIGKDNAPGATAEKLMNKSVKPVWVVPSDTTREFETILCAVDFSDASTRALENAIHLSRQFSLELTVLHVAERRTLSVIEKKLGLKISGSDTTSHQKAFDEYLERFDFYNIRWKKTLAEGSAAEEIQRQAKQQKADLILMGSVGKTAHPKMLNGATARSVFRSLPSAIIAFKSENIIQLKLENELHEIEARFQQGIQLLENGFISEAIAQFKYCLGEDPLFAPAWELLADAHYRLGKQQKALEYKAKASEIRDKLWTQRVEADIKKQHSLYKTR